MPEHNTPADVSPPAETSTGDALAQLVETNNAAVLTGRDDVTAEIVDIEADAEDFERYQEWRGVDIAGATNDADEVLLVKNTDPDVCHDWVLPHGPLRDDDGAWAETAADWVDGLTGVSVDIEDVVHVRRNDITVEHEDGSVDETTTHHVIFSARPRGSEEIHDDVRYDCDDIWTAGWHDSIPESANETEREDIALFVEL